MSESMEKRLEKLNTRFASDYGKITAWMITKQIFTKSEMVAKGVEIGKTKPAAFGTAGVMLSSLEKSKHGDCRGNLSNPWSHLAYCERLPRRTINGEKEERRYRFRYRKVALEPLTRKTKVAGKVEQVKVTPAKVVTPAPVEA